MLIGYARVSTDEQSNALQVDALRQAGCTKIYRESASGVLASRKVLDRALNSLGPGDTLVTWRLDRLGRSLSHLIFVVTELEERGVAFRSLTEAIDTGTASGRLLFHVMGALAEFERSLISERTRAGMTAARIRGRRIGRPAKLTATEVSRARLMLACTGLKRTADDLGVAESTLRRALKRAVMS